MCYDRVPEEAFARRIEAKLAARAVGDVRKPNQVGREIAALQPAGEQALVVRSDRLYEILNQDGTLLLAAIGQLGFLSL